MGKPSSNLTAANIKYLLVIHELGQNGSGVHSINIAERLKVSKPSTHEMLHTLKKRQLICKDSYGLVLFTEEGKRLASKYQTCFDRLSLHFSKLLPKGTDVAAVTCALLAEIKIDDVESLCRELIEENNETCNLD